MAASAAGMVKLDINVTANRHILELTVKEASNDYRPMALTSSFAEHIGTA